MKRKNFMIALTLLTTGTAWAEDFPKDSLKIVDIEEVVVIATPKENRKLRELPVAATVLSQDNMRANQVNSVKNLTGIVPNLFIPDYGSKLTTSIYIRGIGSRINTPSVGLYVDNIPYIDKSAFDFNYAVASAKANAGLKADLYVQFGLSQTGNKFADSYRNPMNQQYASIGISLPILDWGRGKGRVRVARSNVDLVDTQAEQGMKDFELNVCKMVRQFNLQAYRVAVAAKTDKTADRRHDVARRLYILGKSTILDLNAAITEKDTARRNYITALKTYWSLYYGIRSMTGYDFLRKAEISCTIPKP